ncbi:hypothetical protein [Vibrio phage J14]|nr:hypothetical protein [Vibrio phage J14]
MSLKSDKDVKIYRYPSTDRVLSGECYYLTVKEIVSLELPDRDNKTRIRTD